MYMYMYMYGMYGIYVLCYDDVDFDLEPFLVYTRMSRMYVCMYVCMFGMIQCYTLDHPRTYLCMYVHDVCVWMSVYVCA